MEQIIYGITIALYAIFIVRFTLSWVGGDFDVDADLDLGDIVSFKGATHFLMGLSSWLSVKLYTANQIMWYDYIIAFIIGLIFALILFYLYKLMMKLEYKPIILKERDLIGKPAKVYLHCNNNNSKFNEYLITVENGIGTIEVPAYSHKYYNVGEMVTINDYKNSYYII